MKELLDKIKLKRSPFVLLNDLISSATTIKHYCKCEFHFIGGVCIYYIDNNAYYHRVCIDESIVVFFNSYYKFNGNHNFNQCIQNSLRDNGINCICISTSSTMSYAKKHVKPLYEFLIDRYLK